MRVLVVGAGPIGRVIGYHLARGGARVSLLVRERQRVEAERGYSLVRLGRRGIEGGRACFVAESVLTGSAEVARERWDGIVLCVSSNALRVGEWLTELAELGNATAHATWVVLQPGLDDADWVAARVGASQTTGDHLGTLIRGGLTLVSYERPLPGEDAGLSGTAYWTPPGSHLSFWGNAQRAVAFAGVLSRGGLAARHEPAAAVGVAVAGAFLDTAVAGLQCAGWQLGAFRGDPALRRLTARAARQAVTAVALARGAAPPRWLGLVRAGLLKLASGVAPRFTPFPFEPYLAAHFGKLSAQTRLALESFGHHAAAGGTPRDAIERLADRLDAVERSRADGPPGPQASPPSELSDRSTRQLLRRRPLAVDPNRPTAIKRNVHELIVEAEAVAFADAFHRVMADGSRRFGPIRIKRVSRCVGQPFRAGERFHGCFSLSELARPWLQGTLPRRAADVVERALRSSPAAVVEDTLLSDYAEILAIDGAESGAEGARFEVSYGYLSGTPIAGRSTYEVEPLPGGRCRVRSIFEFQELGGLALTALHRFGIRAHDRVVLEQVRQAAELLGARLVDSTLPVT